MNKNKWVHIILEEQNAERGLAHIMSDEAFRYPSAENGDLYIVGKDNRGKIHFLLVEEDEDLEVTIRPVEDPVLFAKLINYYGESSRMPVSDEDEELRRSMGHTSETITNHTVSTLSTSKI